MAYSPGDRINIGTNKEATKKENLDQILDNLADNVSGQIGAHDVRDAVFTLYDNQFTKPVNEGNVDEILAVVSPGVYEFRTVTGIGGHIYSGDEGNLAFYSADGQVIGDIPEISWDGSLLNIDGSLLFTEDLTIPSLASPLGEYYLAIDTNGNVSSVAKDENLRFNLLLDTPSGYSGEGGKMLVVRGDELGIEFITVPPQLDPVTATGASGSIQFADENNNFSSTYEFKWVQAGTFGRIDIIGGAKISELGGQSENIIVSDIDGVLSSRPINDVTNDASGAYGEIQFSDGNTNNLSEFDFVYDNTSGEGRLGVGNLDPQSIIHTVEDNNKLDGGHIIEQIGSGNAILQYRIKTLTEEQQWVSGIDAQDNLKYKIGSNFLIGEDEFNRITIDLDGNIGMGTTNPLNPLHIKTLNPEILRLENTDTSGTDGIGYIAFYNYNDSNNRKALFGFGSTTSNTLIFSNDTGGDINFRSAGNTVLKVIGTSEFVGIRKDDPEKELDIVGNIRVRSELDPTTLWFDIDNTYNGITGDPTHPITGQWATVLKAPTNRSLHIEIDGDQASDRFSIITKPSYMGTPNNEAFIVQNDNKVFMNGDLFKVGVGDLLSVVTTEIGGDSDYKTYIGSSTQYNVVSYDFGVNTTRNSRAKLFLKDGDGISEDKLWGLWQTWDTGGGSDFVLGIGDEKLRIKPSGNIGIGNSNPSSLLHIKEPSVSGVPGGGNSYTGTEAGFTIEQSGIGDSLVQFYLTGGQRYVMGIDNSDDDKFKISTDVDLANDAKFVLNPTTGFIGLNESQPDYQLHVKSDDRDVMLLQSTTNESRILFSTNRDPAIGTSKSGFIGFAESDLLGSNDNLYIYNNAAYNPTSAGGNIFLRVSSSSFGLRVNRRGFIGIGSVSQEPYAPLQITTTGHETLRLYSTSTYNKGGNWMSFYYKGEINKRKGWFGYGSSSNEDFYMRNESGGKIHITTYDRYDTRSAGWITLDKNGKVGIGTTNPNAGLDIVTSSYNTLRLRCTRNANYIEFYKSNSTSRSAYVGYGSTSNDTFYVNNQRSGELQLRTSSTERFTILANGRIYVTNGPKITGSKFNVYGSETSMLSLYSSNTSNGRGANFIQFYKNDSTNRAGWFGWGSTGHNYMYMTNQMAGGGLYFAVQNSIKMALSPSGRLSVGAANSVYTQDTSSLFVVENNTDYAARIYNDTTNNSTSYSGGGLYIRQNNMGTTRYGLIVQVRPGSGSFLNTFYVRNDGLVNFGRVASDFTSTSGANVFMNGSGTIYFSTSSRRYKKNIQPFNDDFNKILNIEPKLYDHFKNEDEVGMLGQYIMIS
jgi:hypothetical protein